MLKAADHVTARCRDTMPHGFVGPHTMPMIVRARFSANRDTTPKRKGEAAYIRR
jgi:hypothetical protein